MSAVHERITIDAPYTQAAAAFERRLGLSAGDEGTTSLLLVAPVTQGRELARTVTAQTRRIDAANYSSRYAIAWPAGRTAQGIPTPGFTGTLILGAGEDYDECELTLEGEYTPPGGALGAMFDGVAGKRIAGATLAALLDGVARELQAEHDSIEAGKPHA